MAKKKGYREGPWIFKGRALYQLSLVRVEEAKKFIPDDLHIVNFFGYTLGGLYLARYDDSPVGSFDECVALAGIVWNKPTSCGWAGRVYVTDREAREHGWREVGLPSRLCSMTKPHPPSSDATPSWWDQPRSGTSARQGEVQAAGNGGEDEVILEESVPSAGWKVWQKLRPASRKIHICSFSGFPSGLGKKGPRVNLKLPSFSGLTPQQPDLMQYTCQIACRLRPLKPLQVSFPTTMGTSSDLAIGRTERLMELIGRQPVMAVAFDDMEMVVQEPRIAPPNVSAQSQWDLESRAPSLVAS